MGPGFKNPNTERTTRAMIEDRMAHTLSSWHGPHEMTAGCARAVWEREHGAHTTGLFQRRDQARPRATTKHDLPIFEFDWGKKNFGDGEASRTIATYPYSIEFDEFGASLYIIRDRTMIWGYPKNIWVMVPENIAMAYYRDSNADTIVVRQTFNGREYEHTSKVIFGSHGRRRYIPDGKVAQTTLRIIERRRAFVPDSEYFLPVFMPDDSAQFPTVFFATTGTLIVNGISADEAQRLIASDSDHTAVFSLQGIVERGQTIQLVRGIVPNPIKNPKTGTAEKRYFKVSLQTDKIERGFRLKPEYSLYIGNDGTWGVQ